MGADPSGIITLHNVSASTNITNLGSHFQFGSMQVGTAAEDTFNFNAAVDGENKFSAFQQFDHITGFDLGTDNIDIALPMNLFEALGSKSSDIVQGLVNNSHPGKGDINVVVANGSTSLQFVSDTTDPYPSGSITLDGVVLTPAAPGGSPDLNDFGSHLHFGFIEQGKGGTDNFNYNYAAAGNSDDLSGWQNFSHILDFDTHEDNLTLKITDALNEKINDLLHPSTFPGVTPSEQSTNQELVEALSTGMANGTSIGTHINVVQTDAQYGNGHDSIFQFITGTSITGTLTFHNLSINSLTDPNAPQLLITH